MNNDIIEHEPQAQHAPVAQRAASAVAAVTPMDLLRHAMDSGADLDRLEKLMGLQERWEANEARKAFADAMADFKKNPPTIFKDKHVGFKTDKGRTEYDHATIGNVVDKVVGAALIDVLSGGPNADPLKPTTEDEIIALERRAFIALFETPETVDRVKHMLTTGKPLRN